jgi:hypothetical protein
VAGHADAQPYIPLIGWDELQRVAQELFFDEFSIIGAPPPSPRAGSVAPMPPSYQRDDLLKKLAADQEAHREA